MVQKQTAFYLRVAQLVFALIIFILEFVQAVGFSDYYYDEPTHSAVAYYWMALTVTSLFLGHLLIRFQPRWRHGPYRDEILLDGFLLFVWLSICILNMSPTLHGKSLTCDKSASPAQARCVLYLINTTFSWFIFTMFMFSFFISVSRWRNKDATPSIPMSAVQKTQSMPPFQKPSPPYTIQKGILKDGQTVLLFNDKRQSKRMSMYGHQRSSSGSTPNLKPFSYADNIVSSTPNLLNGNNSDQSDSRSASSVNSNSLS